MATPDQTTAALQQLITSGCATAEQLAGWPEDVVIEDTQSDLLGADFPVVQSTMAAWFAWMQATYGWHLVDSLGVPVSFATEKPNA